MFSWVRSQVKSHGLFEASRLILKVARYRLPVTLGNKLLSPTLECPCCGWKGRRFLDYIELGYRVPNAACPGCDSHSRHRALYLWLRDDFQIANRTGRALVFAPEPALAKLWESARGLRVWKTDLESVRNVDVLSDIVSLPFKDQSVSLIWCHHVLEQVADDAAALRELFRVLSNTGELVISAGTTGRETTQEFSSANKSLSGNHRLYGSDFIERLREAGFQVSLMNYNLSDTDRKLYAVYPEPFYRCTKPH